MQTYEGKEYPTQALIENCMVCRSQRTGLGFWPAVADGPEVLVVDPAGEIVWYNYSIIWKKQNDRTITRNWTQLLLHMQTMGSMW
jgi:hypothetical protein